MLPALHAAWSTRTIEDLVDLGNRIPAPDFSQLAPLVARCAAEGDAVARDVLQQSGEELADLLVMAIRKGTTLEAAAVSKAPLRPPDPWQVAYTGSVVEKIPVLREIMAATVRRVYPAVEFLPRPADPPLGALWRARQHALCNS